MRSTTSKEDPRITLPVDVSPRRANLQRRGFLLSLGVGGAGVVAAAANKLAAVAPATIPEPAAPAESKGYALNDHIRRYYQTAKV